MAENSGQEQRKRGPGKPWPPGQSGNPAGKPRGAQNLVTRAVEDLLEGDAEALTRKCVDLALAGDTTALRLCMERIAPVRKGRPLKLELPEIGSVADILTAFSVVVTAVSQGEITPDEGVVVANILEVKRKTIETTEIERRLADLEARNKGNG